MEKRKFAIGATLRVVNTAPLPGNDVAPPLEENKTYVAKQECFDKDGNQHIDVGLLSKYNYIRSHETKEELPQGNKIHWCHPSRFELAE